MKENVYFVMESEDYDDLHLGFVFSEEKLEPQTIQNWDMDKEWVPLILKLREGNFADYLVNDLNIPLCSERLKEIISQNADNSSDINWYPIKVISLSEAKEYYYLKLTKTLSNVIDMGKSVVQNNTIIKPYFLEDKIHDVFRCDYDNSYLFFSKKLKDIIVKSKITGIAFEAW